MVNTHEPSVQDMIGFIDFVSFSAVCINELVVQNSLYGVYQYDTTIKNVIPDSKEISSDFIVF